MRLLSIAYWIFLVASSALYFVGALILFLLTAAFDRRRVLLHLYTCFWASSYVYANPLWKLSVEGRGRLPWRGGAVLVANHSSLLDILTIFALYRPFKWVSKASVFGVPFVGWNMVLNDYVPLVRGDKESIGKMMSRCAKHLRAGSPVFLFPEGTRSPDGEVRAFKDGAFRLAIQQGVPLVPIVVRGTADALPKRGFILRRHVRAQVQVLEPIDPAPFAGDVAALRDEARRRIVAALGANISKS